MAATVYQLWTAWNMPAGASWGFTWNNIPSGKAYAADAHPWWPGSYQEGYDSVTQVEVTRFWRRTRSIQKKGSIGVDVEVHNDVLGVVKNVGNHVLHYDMYLTVFS